MSENQNPNSTISIEKPTKESATAALNDMLAPSVYVPGGLAIIALSIITPQHILVNALAVTVTLFLNRLWSRLEKK